MKIIDLSHKLFNGAPSYPSDPKILVKKEKEIIPDRTMLHRIKMGTHSGTHLDVPAHVLENGKTLNEFPLKAFMGTAIKVNNKNYRRIEDIKGKIDAIILDTGWYSTFNNPEVFFGNNRPAIPKDLIHLILEYEIKIFGCDLPSVDESGSKEKAIHNALLGNDVIIYEALNNLEGLPMMIPFEFYGFPLSLDGLDGSPIRAVGVL